ncbi:MAG TPA: hypothetical protein VK582_21965 [Pyrinomonadaceae bacterium]|nr:hypothetical protein [Pyrinomonadaceae bacterium]
MNLLDTFAMREALRHAQEMDTPAMRNALRQAELMDTPAMREASRQAQLMDTPAMREASRQAQLMNTPVMRERALNIERLALTETERRAIEESNNPTINGILDSLRRHSYWEPSARVMAMNSFFSSSAFLRGRDLMMQNDRALRMVASPGWEAMLRSEERNQSLFGRMNQTVRAISEVTQFLNHNKYVEFFPRSFADEVLLTLSTIEEPVDRQTRERFIAKLEELVALLVAKCKELAPNSISYHAMFNFALTISLFVYSLHDTHESERRIIEAVNRTRTEITREIKTLRPVEPNDVYFVVLRKAKLRTEPNLNQRSIEILSVNQRIKLIRGNDKWIYVEYFDYVEGLPKMGWVLKEYTQQIEN